MKAFYSSRYEQSEQKLNDSESVILVGMEKRPRNFLSGARTLRAAGMMMAIWIS